MSKNIPQDTTQKSYPKFPMPKSPVAYLASNVKKELHMILCYIEACLPMLSHVIVHDIKITSHYNSLFLISKARGGFHTPYKLLIILKSDYKESIEYFQIFSKAFRSFCRQRKLVYPPAVTIIGEKEFEASLQMKNNMIAKSVNRGRVIVDIEVEKEWVWND